MGDFNLTQKIIDRVVRMINNARDNNNKIKSIFWIPPSTASDNPDGQLIAIYDNDASSSSEIDSASNKQLPPRDWPEVNWNASKDSAEPISCKENWHDFQFIEKEKVYIKSKIIEYKYYYIFYCKRCCRLINLESPINCIRL